eukprot:GHVS01072224.1.p1 GENE.GHVS01072224.1~~GHVS01072224.1.p1  ORF type:complete len:978 (+),score=153.01 GHVS01072224.1:296-3229(+)
MATAGPLSVDELFRTRSLEGLEEALSLSVAQVADKGQEVRTLVGGKYHTVIESADRIVGMYTTSQHIHDLSVKFGHHTSELISLLQTSRTSPSPTTSPPSTPSTLLSSVRGCAQLLSLPTAVMSHALSNRHLTALHLLFVQAPALHRSLQPSEQLLPAVARQVLLTALDHRRRAELMTRLEGRCLDTLRSTESGPVELLESVASVMLRSGYAADVFTTTQRSCSMDPLHTFFQQRRLALQEAMSCRSLLEDDPSGPSGSSGCMFERWLDRLAGHLQTLTLCFEHTLSGAVASFVPSPTGSFEAVLLVAKIFQTKDTQSGGDNRLADELPSLGQLERSLSGIWADRSKGLWVACERFVRTYEVEIRQHVERLLQVDMMKLRIVLDEGNTFLGTVAAVRTTWKKVRESVAAARQASLAADSPPVSWTEQRHRMLICLMSPTCARPPQDVFETVEGLVESLCVDKLIGIRVSGAVKRTFLGGNECLDAEVGQIMAETTPSHTTATTSVEGKCGEIVKALLWQLLTCAHNMFVHEEEGLETKSELTATWVDISGRRKQQLTKITNDIFGSVELEEQQKGASYDFSSVGQMACLLMTKLEGTTTEHPQKGRCALHELARVCSQDKQQYRDCVYLVDLLSYLAGLAMEEVVARCLRERFETLFNDLVDRQMCCSAECLLPLGSAGEMSGNNITPDAAAATGGPQVVTPCVCSTELFSLCIRFCTLSASLGHEGQSSAGCRALNYQSDGLSSRSWYALKRAGSEQIAGLFWKALFADDRRSLKSQLSTGEGLQVLFDLYVAVTLFSSPIPSSPLEGIGPDGGEEHPSAESALCELVECLESHILKETLERVLYEGTLRSLAFSFIQSSSLILSPLLSHNSLYHYLSQNPPAPPPPSQLSESRAVGLCRTAGRFQLLPVAVRPALVVPSSSATSAPAGTSSSGGMLGVLQSKGAAATGWSLGGATSGVSDKIRGAFNFSGFRSGR